MADFTIEWKFEIRREKDAELMARYGDVVTIEGDLSEDKELQRRLARLVSRQFKETLLVRVFGFDESDVC